jgi:hypothetical protein
MSDDTNVVTTTAVAPVKVPKSFNDLNKAQLVAAAQSFGTLEEGNAAEIKADLAESGVTWDMYARAFKLEGYDELPEEKFEMPEPQDAEDWPDADEEESPLVTAAPVPKLAQNEKYLIKFTGENRYFEFGKYKFTQDNPYGIMPAEDAQRALTEEPEKFRQAFPKELKEYYG